MYNYTYSSPPAVSHFTLCSTNDVAVVFQIPGWSASESIESEVNLRGEVQNYCHLLIRQDKKDHLRIFLPPGSLDTSFQIVGKGEQLSFYFILDTISVPEGQRPVMPDSRGTLRL